MVVVYWCITLESLGALEDANQSRAIAEYMTQHDPNQRRETLSCLTNDQLAKLKALLASP